MRIHAKINELKEGKKQQTNNQHITIDLINIFIVSKHVNRSRTQKNMKKKAGAQIS